MSLKPPTAKGDSALTIYIGSDCVPLKVTQHNIYMIDEDYSNNSRHGGLSQCQIPDLSLIHI